MRVSASSLHRAAACPASVWLPSVRTESSAARRGTEIHAFLERTVSMGRDLALELAPDDLYEACAAIDLTQLPIAQSSAQAFTEIALAFDLSSGKARQLGSHLERKYDIAPAEVPGTADIFWLLREQNRGIVFDYKSGHAVLPPARHNWQLKHLALCAARAFGLREVQAVILQVSPGYTPRPSSATFLEADLDVIEQELREVYAGLLKAQADISEGKEPQLTLGDHCAYCPAIAACPAQRRLISQVLGRSSPLELITTKNAAEAWANIKAANKLLEAAEESVRRIAAEQPIALPNGKTLGTVEKRTESIIGGVAHGVLRQRYGMEIADSAVTFECTKTALRKALGQMAERTGRTLAELERDALKALRDSRAIVATVKESVCEHVRKGGDA